jgi:hypothetical protein
MVNFDRLDINVSDSFDLEYIATATEYKYNYITSGKLKVSFPSNTLSSLYDQMNKTPTSILPFFKGENTSNTFGILLGLVTLVPLKEEFLKGLYTDAIELKGVPKNGVIKLDKKTSKSELKELIDSKTDLILTHDYEIKNLPSQLLPVVIVAELFRDAAEYFLPGDKRRSHMEGISALTITPRIGEYMQQIAPFFRIDKLEIKFQETFPSIRPLEPANGRYDPINKIITWTDINVQNETPFIISGPYQDLTGTKMIECKINATIGDTISGIHVDKTFFLTGIPYSTEKSLKHQTKVTVNAKFEPAALIKEHIKITQSTMSFSIPPFEVYDSLVQCLVSIGAPPLEREYLDNLREKIKPVTHKKDVYSISTTIKTKKEYKTGVVYLDLLVNGEFTTLKTTHDLTDESRQVLKEEGGIKSSGMTEIKLIARSTARELALEFIDEFQKTVHKHLGGK